MPRFIETYWHDHSLESYWGALSDATICFFDPIISGGKIHFLNFSQKPLSFRVNQDSLWGTLVWSLLFTEAIKSITTRVCWWGSCNSCKNYLENWRLRYQECQCWKSKIFVFCFWIDMLYHFHHCQVSQEVSLVTRWESSTCSSLAS
jgi:hypothetical protein